MKKTFGFASSFHFFNAPYADRWARAKVLAVTEKSEKHAVPTPAIGLCLSGGGFRATLFHLGVIRFLRDAHLLSLVRHICSVSGGSILAAHVVRNWGKYTSPKDEQFDRAASEIVRFVRRDVRGRIVRRTPYRLLCRSWRPTPFLRNAYEELFAPELDDSPTPRPELHVLATNLTLGCLCSFESDQIILYRKDGTYSLKTSTLEDATKVAASSAFPAFFQSVPLTAADLGVDPEKFLPEIQLFTDGGVYDNLGIRRLHHLTQETDVDQQKRMSLLLVSDAGRPFGLDLTRDVPGIIKTAWRSSDVASNRIGEFDLRELGAVFNSPEKEQVQPARFRVLSISDEVPTNPGNDALPFHIQRALKSIRTDLDSFSDREILFLVQHGYEVARHTFQQVYTEYNENPVGEVQPEQSSFSQIASLLKDMPEGRWLPPDIAPGWPRDKDPGIWERDNDNRQMRRCLNELYGSSNLKWRLFSLHDPISYLNGAIAAAVIVLILAIVGFAIARWLRLESDSPRVVFSNLSGPQSEELFPVDLSMPGIEIDERLIVVDLSNEVIVPDKDRDVLRISPSVHTYTIKGLRRTTEARYLVYEFSSQRKLMDVSCTTSHPFQVRYRRDPIPGGDGFDNVYTIVVDLNQHSPDIPFEVGFRVTRWNAYQAPNANYVGALVSGDERRVIINAILPYGKIYKSARLQERRQAASVQWTDSSDANQPIAGADKRSFVWVLDKPRKGWAFRAMINWESDPNWQPISKAAPRFDPISYEDYLVQLRGNLTGDAAIVTEQFRAKYYDSQVEWELKVTDLNPSLRTIFLGPAMREASDRLESVAAEVPKAAEFPSALAKGTVVKVVGVIERVNMRGTLLDDCRVTILGGNGSNQ
jgi:predicted acylesterase/phospholipase RssA